MSDSIVIVSAVRMPMGGFQGDIHALKACGLRKGLATLCSGGGEGMAVALELL